MKKTTLCYLEKEGCFLMLYRNRKKNDDNAGKWLGIGGKFEAGETADECNTREVLEETGIRLNSAHFYGVVHFRATTYEDEDMYLYSSSDFQCPEELERLLEANLGEWAGIDSGASSILGAGADTRLGCDEGELKWIPKNRLMELPMWEGDRAFLQKIIDGEKSVSMTLRYVGEECTIEA